MPAGTLSLSSCLAFHAAIARSRAAWSVKRRRRVRRTRQQRLGALGQHQEADRAGQPGGAMVFPREADRDADREEQSQMRENRIARRGDEGDVEQIGLAEAKQHARDRQHRDRAASAPAERLQPVHANGGSSCVSPCVEQLGGKRREPRRAELQLQAHVRASARQSGCGDSADAHGDTDGNAAGTADNSRMPSPTSTSAPSGSERRLPQRLTGVDAPSAASAVIAMSRRTAGCKRIDGRASKGFVRSIASAYCARSLEPIERKSASSASLSGDQRGSRCLDHHAERDRIHRREAHRAAANRRAARRPTRPSGSCTLSASPRTRAIARELIVDQIRERKAACGCRARRGPGSARRGKRM